MIESEPHLYTKRSKRLGRIQQSLLSLLVFRAKASPKSAGVSPCVRERAQEASLGHLQAIPLLSDLEF